MKKEAAKVNGKKAKCSACGHLVERHNKNGTCNASQTKPGDMRGHDNNCLCGVAAGKRKF